METGISCHEREVELCKILSIKGKCLDNECVAFAKNFKL
jgi:hypothetical protein